MESHEGFVAPYKLGPDGQLRPYLLLTLLGVWRSTFSAWSIQVVVKRPCQAFVDGLPHIKFEVEPLFVGGLNALWGRADLMMNFTVSVSEKEKELTLRLPG